MSGFGGTFCLVLSFLYIVGSVVLLAQASPLAAANNPSQTQMLASLAGFLALSIGLGWVPVQLGLRRVRHFEL